MEGKHPPFSLRSAPSFLSRQGSSPVFPIRVGSINIYMLGIYIYMVPGAAVHVDQKPSSYNVVGTVRLPHEEINVKKTFVGEAGLFGLIPPGHDTI